MSGLRHMLGMFLAMCLALMPQVTAADEFKPALLDLVQETPDTFDVSWRLPARDEVTFLDIHPVFPEGTRLISTPRSTFSGGAAVQRWEIRVAGGLEGKPVRIEGGAAGSVEVLVRVKRLDGTEQVDRLLPSQSSFVFTASPGSFEVARTYTVIGIEHILMGIDHLLFVFALLLLVSDRRKLLWTITAFTAAHSITLTLATLRLVTIPGPPVEAAIALSIVFVATEVLRDGKQGLAARKPWLVAFSFGLLHGLGFAGALAQVGLPQNDIPLALLFFNVGVELGQLVFVAAVLCVLEMLKRIRPARSLEPRATVIASYVIGMTATFWVFERVSAF